MRLYILFIFGALVFASPAYSDYALLNKAFDTYTLPKQTIPREVPEPGALPSGTDPGEIAKNKLTAVVEKLKADHVNRLNTFTSIRFLNLVDTKVLTDFIQLSKDDTQVEYTIKDRVVLSQIEILAALRNPAILAARKKVAAEIESFSQVMALDDTLRQYSAFSKGLDLKAGPVKMKDSIALKYPYPGISSLKAQVIQQEVAILTLKMEQVEKQVITDTRKAFWQLVFVNTSQTIMADTIDAFNRLKDVATALYKSGKTSFQDVIKINIQLAVLKEDLKTLGTQKKNIDARLLELLNLPGHHVVGSPVFQSPYKKTRLPKDLFPVARTHRSELAILRATIKKTEGMIEIAGSMIHDPYTFNFSLLKDEGEKPFFAEKTMAAMKNNLPGKPWFGIDDPWLKGTQQKLLSLRQTLISTENATDTLIREAWFNVDKNHRELSLYENQILSLSRSALEVTTREYESGAIPFSQAIDSYTTYLQVKLTIARKQSDLGTHLSQLENLVGKSF